jgi:hypothetical protein
MVVTAALAPVGSSLKLRSMKRTTRKNQPDECQCWLPRADEVLSVMVKLVTLFALLKLLYGLVILHFGRRRLVWANVTANPTAEWIAEQITEAFAWDEAPRYLIRDRDASYGAVVTQRLQAMGIRDRPTAPRSP